MNFKERKECIEYSRNNSGKNGFDKVPHKVLMKLGEKPVLGNIVDRISKSRMVNKIVIATSTEPEDDEIAVFCNSGRIECFRTGI